MDKIRKAIAEYENAFAIWTDRADFITDKNADLQVDKLLELRCFDVRGEYKAFRDVPGDVFCEREITAENESAYADGSYDESQYLDIDEARTKDAANGIVYSAGGGSYHLPTGAVGKSMVLVRHYYRFDNEGIAFRYDWRLVDFTNVETVGKEAH